MTLGELIKRLEKYDQDSWVGNGISSPHSYRGFYDQVAAAAAVFELAPSMKVSEMLTSPAPYAP